MDNRNGLTKRLRAIISLVLVALYVLGLIAMITFSFQTGLVLWVVSTVGGIGLLYWIRTTDKSPEQGEKTDAGSDDGEGTRNPGE